MKTERALHLYFKRKCRFAGVAMYKVTCVGQTGFPDLMLIYDGWTEFVELKSPTGAGRLSERQKYMLNELNSHGASTHVISNAAGADALIADLTGR